MKKKIQNEPVITVSIIVGAIMATLTALISMDVVMLTDEQLAAIQKAMVAVFPLVLLGTAAIQRQFVSPVSK